MIVSFLFVICIIHNGGIESEKTTCTLNKHEAAEWRHLLPHRAQSESKPAKLQMSVTAACSYITFCGTWIASIDYI